MYTIDEKPHKPLTCGVCCYTEGVGISGIKVPPPILMTRGALEPKFKFLGAGALSKSIRTRS